MMPEAGPKTVERFERARRDLRRAWRLPIWGFFGIRVLKAGDKVFAGTFGDAMTFRPSGPTTSSGRAR